jgi:preprotein translocase subunit SecE
VIDSSGYLHHVWREVRKVAWPTQRAVAHDSALLLAVTLLVIGASLALEAGFAKAAYSVFS